MYFFYSYNVDTFMYLCYVHIIFRIILCVLLYLNYFFHIVFLSYNRIVFNFNVFSQIQVKELNFSLTDFSYSV